MCADDYANFRRSIAVGDIETAQSVTLPETRGLHYLLLCNVTMIEPEAGTSTE